MKHIRHTPVTAEQYLRDQTNKTKAQTPVIFSGTDPTKHHSISYDPYMHIYMYHISDRAVVMGIMTTTAATESI